MGIKITEKKLKPIKRKAKTKTKAKARAKAKAKAKFLPYGWRKKLLR